MNQIIVGFTSEGTTDTRLLESIVLRTFEAVAVVECTKQIEVINPIIHIKKALGEDFNNTISNCAQIAFSNGVMVFCVHVDADDSTDKNVMDTKINPCFEGILASDNLQLCKNLVSIVPVSMTEAWMLADKNLLKEEIGTDKTDSQLGIHRSPEAYADPKSTIENAIRVARQDMPRRRRYDLKIAELYQPIGQKLDLEKLEALQSYRKFRDGVKEIYRKLNYL
ncbi:MAG TPA: hypothetical protein VNY73_09230 [Bacteroidia bacterium]|jgi:hypothetical protein|nr:hypothetical protein [Bacteroidia bacterium]